MDWNGVEGNSKNFKGKAKEKWGQLTNDDLDVIDGRREQLEGRLQERYGYAKDQARKEVDDGPSRYPDWLQYFSLRLRSVSCLKDWTDPRSCVSRPCPFRTHE